MTRKEQYFKWYEENFGEYFYPNKITEKELIKELGLILKADGYKKRGKFWHKQINADFTFRFCVQTSSCDKNDYDVNFGVSVNIPNMDDNSTYGHFCAGVCAASGRQVYDAAIKYLSQFTDKEKLREGMRKIKEWRDRNPLEYLRSLPADAEYEQPPFPIPIGEDLLTKYILSPEFLDA
jgi:hypothetical protein